MNDTLQVKDLDMSTIGATQLPGSARDFSRIASEKLNDALRSSSHLGSLNPTVLRIAQTPRSVKNKRQRSLAQLKQSLTRVDAASNPISQSEFALSFTGDIPADVSLTEFRTGASTLFGALLANNGALLDQIYYGQL